MVMQSNHLSHFLLTELLLPALRRRAARVRGAGGEQRGAARIVHVSSIMHFIGDVSSKARVESGNTDPATVRLGGAAYADAELMQVMCVGGSRVTGGRR